jgi:flagellar hook-associated protein FlgK
LPKSENPVVTEINSMLQRYHSLKAGYLADLHQLEEQVNFHRREEEVEVEKINHLMGELAKKNDRIKELCSLRAPSSSPLPFQ